MNLRCVRVTSCVLAATGVLAAGDANWPQFRGVGARGVADGAKLPVSWSVAEGKNVAWKTAIPGLGHSGPVVWGDAVFVTTAVGPNDGQLKVGLYGDIEPVADDAKHSFRLLRLDRKTGAVVWERTAYEGVPEIKRHPKSSHANPTPATDGKVVAASFGSEGLFVYDMDGTLLWKKDFGLLESSYFQVPTAQWGFASSPIVHDGVIIVQADVLKDSFLAAFDAKTGKELWRTSRDDVPTWSTPTVNVEEGRAQILVNGFRHIGGYDLKTGKELWRMSGGGDIPIPTPYVSQGLIYLTSSHGGGSPIFAIRTSASGDITLPEGKESSEHVAFRRRDGSYMPTSLVYGSELYVLRDNGVLSAYNAKTGERLYQQRLGPGGSSGYTASLVAGDGKVYATSELGQVDVVRAGPKFESLAENEMDEVCMATPAISGDLLLYRTQGHLVALASR
jgi:outer membrane protein assembly factor BamB